MLRMLKFRRYSLRLLARAYPFYSGCGMLANSKLFKDALQNEIPEMVVTLKTRAKIIVPTDDYIGRAIYYFGDLDPKITWICGKILRPGDVVLDIGANLGLVALSAAAMVGDQGIVHAFEPQPNLADMLRRSAHANGFLHLQVHGLALGADEGTCDLFVPDSNAGSASLVRRDTGLGRSVAVPVRHAGRYLESLNLPPIRLMKIDVEGYESHVVAAASELMRRSGPDTILFELNDYSKTFSAQTIVKQLVDLGYEFLAIKKNLLVMRLFRIDMYKPQDRYGNDILAVRKGSLTEDIMARVNAR